MTYKIYIKDKKKLSLIIEKMDNNMALKSTLNFFWKFNQEYRKWTITWI